VLIVSAMKKARLIQSTIPMRVVLFIIERPYYLVEGGDARRCQGTGKTLGVLSC